VRPRKKKKKLSICPVLSSSSPEVNQHVLVKTQASASDRSRVLARAIPARSASRNTSPRGAGGAGTTRRVGLDVAIEAALTLLVFAFGLLRKKLGAGGGLPLELRGRDDSMERDGRAAESERARERRTKVRQRAPQAREREKSLVARFFYERGKEKEKGQKGERRTKRTFFGFEGRHSCLQKGTAAPLRSSPLSRDCMSPHVPLARPVVRMNGKVLK